MKLRNVTLRSAVAPSRAARLEPEYRAWVNHELFYFADSLLLARFRKEPTRWVGKVTDPVTRVRFRPTARSPRLEHDGRPYYFQSRQALVQFSAMPDSFALRKGM